MADEPNNLVLALLRELRADMKRGFDEVRAELHEIRQAQQATDAENSAILGALVSDVGKVKEAVLEFVIEVGRLKKRIEAEEEPRPRA